MAKKLSFIKQIIAEKNVCILLVRGQHAADGSTIFAYVAVRGDKLETFMEAQQSGDFYPEDFGILIEWGEGEPSTEIRNKMETEYGFNHTAMLDIPNPDAAFNITITLPLSLPNKNL